MSYILEALKKAQAERQLGSAPTIHAVPLHPAPVPIAAARRPMLAGLGAGVVVAGVAAYFLISQRAPAPAHDSDPATIAAVVPTPVVPRAPASQVSVPQADAPQRAVPLAPASPPVAAGAAAVLAAAPRPGMSKPVVNKTDEQVSAPVRTTASGTAPTPQPVASQPAAAAPAPAQTNEAVNASAARPQPEPPVVPEVSAPSLSELPEHVRREVPQIAVGGYIYSANPADRLLLIDKVLRREGEEVAPGLVLERLLPKAAVMNYRGYRYRLPY